MRQEEEEDDDGAELVVGTRSTFHFSGLPAIVSNLFKSHRTFVIVGRNESPHLCEE